MHRGGQRPGSWLRRRRAAGGTARSIYVAWIAILALVAQLAVVQTHAMASPGPSDAVAALGVLKGLLGPNVALCAHDDASAPGAPSHESHQCCVDCALCHATGPLALAPPYPSAPTPFTRGAKPLGVQADAGPAEPRAVAAAQPRGPPVPV